MHRKETAAAKVALAKRRQRLKSGNNNSAQGGGGDASTASASAASSVDNNARRININNATAAARSQGTSATAGRPRQHVKQSTMHSESDEPHWKGMPSSRRSPKVVPLDTDSASETDYGKGAKSFGAGHTIAGHTVDGTITTAAMTEIMERSQQVAEKSSKILDASLSKSKSYDTTTSMGEANIETVLRDDGYVQEVEVRHRRTPPTKDVSAKPTSPTTRERISNFGFVEVHSPQPPSISERRATQQQQQQQQRQSYYRRPGDLVQQQTVERRPQHQLRTIAPSHPQPTMTPASTRDEQSMGTVEVSSAASKNLHVPSLKASTPAIQQYPSRDHSAVNFEDTDMDEESQQSMSTQESTDNERAFEYSGRKTNVNTSKTSVQSVSSSTSQQQGRPPTSPLRPFQRPPSPVAQTLNRQPSSTPTDHAGIEKATSLKSAQSAAESSNAGRLTVSTSGLVFRKSRIPSPKPLDHPRTSPRSPQLPPSGRNSSPPKQSQAQSPLRRPQATRLTASHSVASSSVATGNTSRIPSSKTTQQSSAASKPTAAQSFMSKRRLAEHKTITPVNNIRPVSAQSVQEENLEPSPKHPSPRIDRLSDFIDKSLTIGSSQQPQQSHPQQRTDRTDPVLQSRASMDQSIVQKTVNIQRTIRVQQMTRNSGSPSNTAVAAAAVTQTMSVDDHLDGRIQSRKQRPAVSPIERYRAEADDYDYEQERIERERQEHAMRAQEEEQMRIRQQEQQRREREERYRQQEQQRLAEERQQQQEIARKQHMKRLEEERARQRQLEQERARHQQQQQQRQQQQQTPQHEELNQYQFQHSTVREGFSPRTPQTSRNATDMHEGYSYESPGHAFQAIANKHSNIFQTPQHLSPLPSHKADNVVESMSVGDVEEQLADAACLCSGHVVVLRSCQTTTTIQAKKDQVLAAIDGQELGLNSELLVIEKVPHREDETQPPELRFGDVVILRSLFADGKAFGTRKRRNDIKGVDELGFFDVGHLRSDRWTVLPAKSGKEIVIGRAALSLKKTAHEKSFAALVKSGTPVLLRNCYNGGVLSIRDGKVILMTDSYDASYSMYSDDPTSLGRLQHHYQLAPSLSESFQMLLPSVPPCPSWSTSNGVGERIFLDGAYAKNPKRGKKIDLNEIAYDEMDPKTYEKILIDEVIGSFLGLEGLHVKLVESTTLGKGPEFHLVEAHTGTFNRSLQNLTEQILPLSTSYLRVRNFVLSHYPGYEFGRVIQALCESLDSYLYQFASFVADLEQKFRKPNGSGVVTMKSIHFEITPLLHSMSILEHITESLAETKGGASINTLWSLEKRMYMGDSVAKDLIGTLLDKCSGPYVEMLSTWLHSGALRDPYNEFMVVRIESEDNRKIFDGDSWTTLFKLNKKHVINDIIPNEKLKKKILVTGKYWNAIQACDVDIQSLQPSIPAPPKITKFRFQSDSSAIATFIDTTYQNASKSLINLLRDKFRLMDSLQIMKRYFLLDQGDFFMNFLDAAEEELTKPIDEISSGRVQHFLSMSIQITEAQREGDIDPVLQDDDQQLIPKALKCRFTTESLVAYLDSLYGGITDHDPKTPSRQPYGSSGQEDSGFDLFTIDFAVVPFPTSLILSLHSMKNYKLLFRHLFFAKHVERRLVAVWSDHQLLKKLDSLRGLLGPSFLLRQRMLHFVQNLNNYMTFEVIENNWIEMTETMYVPDSASYSQQEQTIDDILEIHDDFLAKTLDACLLTNPALIKSLTKLLKTCLLFTEQMKRFMNTTRIYDDSINLAAEKRGAVQRNLNERGSSAAVALDKKRLRRALDSVKEERLMLHHRQTRRVGREVCGESYKRMVHRFEEVFTADLAVFMMQLNTHTASGTVANLGMRLDWNGFVTASIASNPMH